MQGGSKFAQALKNYCFGGVLLPLALNLGTAQPSLAESDWESISNDKARIVFDAPGLAQRRSAKFESRGSWSEIAILRGRYGELPRAALHHVELWPGYVFPTKHDVKESTKDWAYFKDEALQFSKEATLINKLGKVTYFRFSKAADDCVAFQSYFGVTSGGRNNWGVPMQFVEGYYCAPEKLSDGDIEAALATLFVKPR